MPGEEAVRNYKKGDELEALVLAIDVERERISLGIKQIDGDPFNGFVCEPRQGRYRERHGQVAATPRARSITLDGDVEGYLGFRGVRRTRGRHPHPSQGRRQRKGGDH